ncbi:MAG TPA: hypothetical protein VKY92_04070 [Verrucomicrobiae bacterium]|jgi:hypothetical protein|nr:hypothetical protein [Verrucomicrobiae bacterium]
MLSKTPYFYVTPLVLGSDLAHPKPSAASKINVMAVKRHLRGASSKQQRQYEHIKKSAQRSGRYGKRAKEVAARTVMKQRKRKKKS